jgi:hypothetical protein
LGKLKERIIQIGLLYFIDYDRRLHVAVHASEDGVGGYPYQYDADGQMRIAAYCSRALTPTERKWSTLEQESYAVLFAVTKFDSWAVICIRIIATCCLCGRFKRIRFNAGGVNSPSMISQSIPS